MRLTLSILLVLLLGCDLDLKLPPTEQGQVVYVPKQDFVVPMSVLQPDMRHGVLFSMGEV